MLCASLYLIMALSSLFSSARMRRVYWLSSMCGRRLSSSRSFTESMRLSSSCWQRADLMRSSSWCLRMRSSSRSTCFCSCAESSWSTVLCIWASFCRSSLLSSRSRRMSSLLAPLLASRMSMFTFLSPCSTRMRSRRSSMCSFTEISSLVRCFDMLLCCAVLCGSDHGGCVSCSVARPCFCPQQSITSSVALHYSVFWSVVGGSTAAV
mmetsp:Transcript_4819/g.8053  ORF Transcript_4819/g.8053 Transcript_4819/m.8053 type:complete len:208 (+) Transcript_4819:1122-1745(+)